MKWVFFLMSAVAIADIGFDVNDVSYLFVKQNPYDRPYPEINGKLLPDTIFKDILSFLDASTFPTSLSGGNTRIVLHDDARKLQGWQVQSFRVDNCGPRAGQHEAIDESSSGPKCDFHFRVVMQPSEMGTHNNIGQLSLGFLGGSRQEDLIPGPGPGNIVTTDNALHLIYSISQKSDQTKLLVDLKKLKDASPVPTSGKALGAHPGLMEELRKGGNSFGAQVRKFIETYAKPEALVKITFFGPTNRVWVFVAGKVEKDAKQNFRWTVMPLENVSNSKFQIGRISNINTGVPKTTAVNPYGVERTQFDTATKPGESQEEADRRMYYQIPTALHPFKIHSENIDCVSCHLSSLDFYDETKFYDRAATLAYVSAPNFYEIPKGVTPFASFAKEVLTGYPQMNNWNMRAFGYYFGQPVVSFRTLLESVRVADSLNKQLKLDAPTKGCKSKDTYSRTLEKFSKSHPYNEESAYVTDCAN